MFNQGPMSIMATPIRTLTVVQLIYNFAFFGGNNLGRAAALSIMLLAALLIANVLQFRGLRGKEA